MASALDFAPQTALYWSARQRDRVFGANYNAFATKFTGFSMCHPTYDDQLLFKSVQHAIRSANYAETPTATFMFVPNWTNKSLNPYMRLLDENPELCTHLGMIPQAHLRYNEPAAWNGSLTTLSKPTWSMTIVVVWDTAAKEHLQASSPCWLQSMSTVIP